MPQNLRKRPSHLRLVEPPDTAGKPPILTNPAAREEFEHLTQRLFDLLVEMMDLTDGDPDREPNGDEFEDSDGI